MQKILRIGVIGTGSIAQTFHLPILSRMEDVEMTAVMSGHIETAEKAKRTYHFEHASDNINDFISAGLDCAFVLTPKPLHASQAIPLLKAGIDVFCEKPLGMNLKEAAEMTEAAEKAGKHLMIGFNRRFAPVYQAAKKSYETTKPDVIIAQKNRPASEYRATLENAIHMVDLMRFIAGEATEVYAKGIFTDPDYETLTTAMLGFENGTVGMLIADRASGQWEETMELHGSNQTVFVNCPDSVTVVDSQQSHTTTLTPLAMGWARVEDKLGFRQSDEHFLECCRTRVPPLTCAQDSFKTMELMNRILKSAGLPDLE